MKYNTINTGFRPCLTSRLYPVSPQAQTMRLGLQISNSTEYCLDCFCLKAQELRNGERCMDSKFKSHDAQLNNIHGDCWYFQQLYARISRTQAPWRPGAVLSMDRSFTHGGVGDLGVVSITEQLILRAVPAVQAFVTQHC